MPEPLTKQEREKIQEWAQETWDEGLAEPAMMARVLELMRYEETLRVLEENGKSETDAGAVARALYLEMYGP